MKITYQIFGRLFFFDYLCTEPIKTYTMTKIKINVEKAQAMLQPQQALDLLATHKEGRKVRVHSFMSTSFALMGCDMDLTQVKAIFKKAKLDEIVLSGPHMKAVGHGVAFWENGKGWTFLATDSVKLDAIYKLKRI
jgi:hypothetical protein